MSTETAPSPVPNEDYVESLWRSVTEGLITWQELRGLQAEYLVSREPVQIDTVALHRQQVAQRLARAQAQLERDRGTGREATTQALVAYWKQQQERAK